jgi:type II secretory pathway pseudopilin PulG
MIELLMVIILVGVLSAIAIPQFLDFRKEGKAAATRFILNALRIGIKNQTANARLRCGAVVADDPNSNGFYNLLAYSLWYNDITALQDDPTYRICTSVQIPNATERKFWELPSSQTAGAYINGINSGTTSIVPANPFMSPNTAAEVAIRIHLKDSEISGYGGRCATADFLTAGGVAYHWIYSRDTGDIFAGTNTPGVNECNF